MRIVLCDEDVLLREVVEALVTKTGHEIAGVADTTADAVGLIEAGRPDAVILELSLGYNTDFDIIDSAIAVGARPIVFSRNADDDVLRGYPQYPTVVPKPDISALEQVLVRLGRDNGRGEVVEHDRRRRPARSAAGPVPTGTGDAQAFFEAINDALPGDGLVCIDVSADADGLASDASDAMRETDRLLAFPTSLRLYLPASGPEGIDSLLRRLWHTGALAHDARVTSVVVADGEAGADAFDRLRHHGDVHELPPAP